MCLIWLIRARTDQPLRQRSDSATFGFWLMAIHRRDACNSINQSIHVMLTETWLSTPQITVPRTPQRELQRYCRVTAAVSLGTCITYVWTTFRGRGLRKVIVLRVTKFGMRDVRGTLVWNWFGIRNVKQLVHIVGEFLSSAVPSLHAAVNNINRCSYLCDSVLDRYLFVRLTQCNTSLQLYERNDVDWYLLIMLPPLIGGGIKRWCCLTSVWRLTSVYLLRTSGLSREQRGLGRPKLAQR